MSVTTTPLDLYASIENISYMQEETDPTSFIPPTQKTERGMFWESFHKNWKISGIKSIRRQTSLGLKEAKVLWEELEEVYQKAVKYGVTGSGIQALRDHPTVLSGENREVEVLSLTLLNEEGEFSQNQVSIQEALGLKKPVHGVKNIRFQTGHGLKKAKEIWDELHALFTVGGIAEVMLHPLVKSYQSENVSSEDMRILNTAVHAAKSQEASSVNKEGVAAQLRYLCGALGTEQVRDIFPHLFV
jgi:ribosomal protein L7/L12